MSARTHGQSSLKTTTVRCRFNIVLICLSNSLFLSRLAQVYTASSQIIKRIILRHLEHPVSTLIQLSLFRIVNLGLLSIKSTLSKTETAGTSTNCPSYAPINVKPQGGGGGADPGEFDILMEARVKFPTPRHLLNVNFPPLG